MPTRNANIRALLLSLACPLLEGAPLEVPTPLQTSSFAFSPTRDPSSSDWTLRLLAPYSATAVALELRTSIASALGPPEVLAAIVLRATLGETGNM